MFKSIPHSYSKFAGQELKWLRMDTKELYLKNFKNNHSKLEKYGWINAPITYKFNNYGFRSDEFSHDPNIMFLGCSHTCGIGISVEHTWANIVSKTVGLKNFNLGIGGSSNDTAFRLAQHWIPQLIPSIVMFLSADHSRFELHNGNQIKNYGAGQDFGNGDQVIPWKIWISNDTNGDMNYLKNTLAIEQVCAQHSIKFLHIEQGTIRFHEHDLARDLVHGGIECNQSIAEQFLSKM
jgi:hypothetical protein